MLILIVFWLLLFLCRFMQTVQTAHAASTPRITITPADAAAAAAATQATLTHATLSKRASIVSKHLNARMDSSQSIKGRIGNKVRGFFLSNYLIKNFFKL